MMGRESGGYATLAHCNEPRWRARLDLSVLIALFQGSTNRQLANWQLSDN